MENREFDGYRKLGTDADIEKMISDHCTRFNIDPLTATKFFPVLARRQWLKRFMAHHDLFQKTIDVPGDIAELGVFRGLGLMSWANMLEAYCIGNRTKIVYGFDNWEGFPNLSAEDGKEEPDVQKIIGGFSPGHYYDELVDAIAIFDSDRFIPFKNRIKLVKGNIEETVVQFTDSNPGVRFSLIHFDCDLYNPTKVALECLWERLSRGGVIIFDEYGLAEWPGETKAVDDFFSGMPQIQIKVLPWTNSPAGYFVKD